MGKDDWKEEVTNHIENIEMGVGCIAAGLLLWAIIRFWGFLSSCGCL
ncbi:MAG: hypothetical protein PHQ43_01115 [Dehalococcoidales bacterium]|nr:hypothetical protein [Dehalococcoidales bacterium]